MTSKDVLFQIKLAMLYQDVTQKDIAEKTGINLRTLQRRFMKPDDFTIDELIKISELLNIKLGFIYATISTQPFITTNPLSISPTITPNTMSDCENCWWFKQQKINPNHTVITAGDTPCTWCSKIQPTCVSSNKTEGE